MGFCFDTMLPLLEHFDSAVQMFNHVLNCGQIMLCRLPIAGTIFSQVMHMLGPQLAEILELHMLAVSMPSIITFCVLW
jgi:hypothetical protein